MKITFLGAAQQVGQSAFLVQSEINLMLDCGMKVHDANQSELPHLERIRADALILSHAHLDHSGAAPALYKNHAIPAFATFPTMPLVSLLWEDSEKIAILNKTALPYGRKDVQRLTQHAMPMDYGAQYQFYEGTKFSFIDAGHILGSAQILLENKKTLLYTGDFKTEPTRLHAGAKAPDVPVDAMIMESTYAGKEHTPRKELEKKFCEEVQDAVDHDLTVLVPAFAVGRAQEMLMILQSGGVDADIWMDGMAKAVTGIMMDYPAYVRNAKALKSAVQDCRFVETHEQRRAAARKPGVIISTSGMMDGGPILSYLKAVNHHGKGAVFLTGYQGEGSNGEALLKGDKVRFTGYAEKIRLPIKQFDFSGHSSGSELLKYAKEVDPEYVYCVHGDDESCRLLAQQLKEEGFNASAPKAGDSVDIA
ncbi:MBL fold metallo-hydrolase [Candidatus Micrarchaeota archaeon]|nr:MBL fold metallo-hydrolase [Candidatus Micrarchaeota archaeon]